MSDVLDYDPEVRCGECGHPLASDPHRPKFYLPCWHCKLIELAEKVIEEAGGPGAPMNPRAAISELRNHLELPNRG